MKANEFDLNRFTEDQLTTIYLNGDSILLLKRNKLYSKAMIELLYGNIYHQVRQWSKDNLIKKCKNVLECFEINKYSLTNLYLVVKFDGTGLSK